jgi:DUF1009 family protein
LKNYGSLNVGEIEHISKTLQTEEHENLTKKKKQERKSRLQKINKDRENAKNYMDKLTNSDPEILSLVIDLINPELKDLTEIML